MWGLPPSSRNTRRDRSSRPASAETLKAPVLQADVRASLARHALFAARHAQAACEPPRGHAPAQGLRPCRRQSGARWASRSASFRPASRAGSSGSSGSSLAAPCCSAAYRSCPRPAAHLRKAAARTTHMHPAHASPWLGRSPIPAKQVPEFPAGKQRPRQQQQQLTKPFWTAACCPRARRCTGLGRIPCFVLGGGAMEPAMLQDALHACHALVLKGAGILGLRCAQGLG